jgi:xanthine dehydrogenase molybdopterin-binding subunit B
MPEGYTWRDLISKAYLMNVDISARHFVTKDMDDPNVVKYDIYAAACSEVLIDVLTGDKQVLRTDILYDCGQSYVYFSSLGDFLNK